jgi:hypothetical protein
MKKGYGYFLLKSCFEIEIGFLGVKIMVILYSLILRKKKKALRKNMNLYS